MHLSHFGKDVEVVLGVQMPFCFLTHDSPEPPKDFVYGECVNELPGSSRNPELAARDKSLGVRECCERLQKGVRRYCRCQPSSLCRIFFKTNGFFVFVKLLRGEYSVIDV